MRRRNVYLLVAIVLAVFWTGCAPRRESAKPTRSIPKEKARKGAAVKPKVVLAADKTGKVAKVNMSARFVVLNFPVGWMPESGTPFVLFRNGLQVGEVKISGPQLDDNVVADLVAGEAAVGDEARVP